MPTIAEVAVSGTTYSFDMLFSYRLPERMRAERGCRVLVPFGRGNSRRIGIIVRITEGVGEKLKPVAALVDAKPVISDELLQLGEYLHDHTFCTYYDGLRIMLPPAMSVRAKERFQLAKDFSQPEQLTPEAAELLESLKCADSDVILTEMVESYISQHGRLLPDELTEAGALRCTNNFKQTVGDDSSERRLSAESPQLQADSEAEKGGGVPYGMRLCGSS